MADQPCVLGKSINIRGDISGDEDLIVQGRIEGTITIGGHLSIEEGADVEASVEASDLTVGGTLRGDVSCSQAVALRSNARLTGDVHALKISIEEGAVVSGRLEMEFELPDSVPASRR